MKLAISLCVALVVCQAAADVQTRPGSIEGYVTDADGGLLPGVTVTVSSASLPMSKTLTSDPRGRFDVSQLAAGDYQVSLQLPDFRTARGSVAVKPGAASGVTFQMAVGSLEEGGDSPLVETSRGRPARASGRVDGTRQNRRFDPGSSKNQGRHAGVFSRGRSGRRGRHRRH